MSKLIWSSVFLFLVAFTVLFFIYYPQLNLINGFAAKNICSCTFQANMETEMILEGDNGFFPVSLADTEVSINEQSASSSFFGLKPRKAVYKEGIGCTLLPEGENTLPLSFVPAKRVPSKEDVPFPYGVSAPIDTSFYNVNYTVLEKAVNRAISGHSEKSLNSRAVLVLYKDHLIAEEYASGFSKETRFQGWSMTKSVLNGIYGVMEKQGKVFVQQDKLFHEWENDERAEITLNNLFQMNSGLAWEEDYTKISDVTKMLFMSVDMPRVQLQKSLSGTPNQDWNYSSGTSNLLSKYLRDQFPSHKDYLDFWYKEFVDKIGMHSMTIETDLRGTYVGSSYSWATARDWAKFGLLYLRKGNWDGKQIFNESWVDYTVTPTNGSDQGYGAHFWLNAGKRFPNVPEDMFSSNGFQGQHVFIIPSKDLVVVRFGLKEHPDFDVDAFLAGIIASIES